MDCRVGGQGGWGRVSEVQGSGVRSQGLSPSDPEVLQGLWDQCCQVAREDR